MPQSEAHPSTKTLSKNIPDKTKSHFSKDILSENDTQIVCTSSEEIVHVKNAIVSQHETMMSMW